MQPKPLTREQVEHFRAAGNYTKAAQEMGIGSGRAARIKRAGTLEEALQIAGTLEPPMEPAPEDPTAVPSNGDHPPDSDGRGKPPPAKAPASKKPDTTKSLTEATIVTIVPRRLEINSTLLLVAKKATEEEWGWPVMEVGQWLDNFLYRALAQRGIVIGSYIRIGKEQ